MSFHKKGFWIPYFPVSPSASSRNIFVRILNLIYLSDALLLFFLVHFQTWVVVHINFIFSILSLSKSVLFSFLSHRDTDPT